MTTRQAFAVRWPVAEAHRPLYALIAQAVPDLQAMLTRHRLVPVASPAWTTLAPNTAAVATAEQMSRRLGLPWSGDAPRNLHVRARRASLLVVVPVVASAPDAPASQPGQHEQITKLNRIGLDSDQIAVRLGLDSGHVDRLRAQLALAYPIGADGLGPDQP